MLVLQNSKNHWIKQRSQYPYIHSIQLGSLVHLRRRRDQDLLHPLFNHIRPPSFYKVVPTYSYTRASSHGMYCTIHITRPLILYRKLLSFCACTYIPAHKMVDDATTPMRSWCVVDSPGTTVIGSWPRPNIRGNSVREIPVTRDNLPWRVLADLELLRLCE